MLNKNDIKKILMSMRTTQNENQVNNLLGKIDLLPEEKLQCADSHCLLSNSIFENCFQKIIRRKVKC